MIAHYGHEAPRWQVEDGWRVERHPRLVADITGNGRTSVVAFGDGGVYVSTL